LLIGAETLSKVTDWQDRNTAYFSATAQEQWCLAEKRASDILSVFLGSDGNFEHLLKLPAGGSRLPRPQNPGRTPALYENGRQGSI